MKAEDVMKMLSWIDVASNNMGCATLSRDEVQGILALLREKDAEIERLQGALKAEERHNELTMEYAKKALANARADAITEFAKLWKKWWYGQIQVCVNAYQESIIYDAIDQIAKEIKKENENGSIDI